MLRRKAKHARFLALIFIASAFFSGCKDDPTTLGLDVIPQEDLIGAFVISKYPRVINVMDDRIRTDGFIKSSPNLNPPYGIKNYYGILGYFNDPRFGVTKADIVTEIGLIGEDVEPFKVDQYYSVDSLILNLSYVTEDTTGWIGDPEATPTINVYELNQRISPPLVDLFKEKRYSNTPIEGQYYPELIGQVQNLKTQQDTIYAIQIRLNEELTNRFFNMPASALKNDAALKDFFHGFYVTVEDPANPARYNSLIKLNLDHTKSNLTLHYKQKITVVKGDTIEKFKETFTHIFPINRTALKFNRYTHTPGDKIQFESEATPFLHIQNMAGSYVKFEFNNQMQEALETIEQGNKNYNISNIDLIFDAAAESRDELNLNMSPISQLMVFVKDAEGNFIIPTFYEAEADSTLNIFMNSGLGAYNAETTKYKFRMNSDYFLSVAKGVIPDAGPFYLRAITPEFDMRRTLLNNSDDALKPRLEIRYMEYE